MRMGIRRHAICVIAAERERGPRGSCLTSFPQPRSTMRIAQVSSLYESVPPKLYGGTERVVSFLTEELVEMGHEVTLFASGDSQTTARLISTSPMGLRLDPSRPNPLLAHVTMLGEVVRRAYEFDIIHWHIEPLHYPLVASLSTPSVTTQHGRQDLPENSALYGQFPEVAQISISNDQRRPMPEAGWVETIYHGLPETLLHLDDGSGDYLAFLGRISPEKRCDRAIEIARRSGMKLKIAAKVDDVDREYFHREIEPLLATPGVEFIGEVDDRGKQDFLGKAKALLFPIGWPEPFGLVMIEAMACGTPIIAYPHGSVPEVIDDGGSGFVVDSIDAAVAAVKRVDELERKGVREHFERRFTARRMAEDHLALYNRLTRRTTRKIAGGSSLTAVAAKMR